MKNKRKIIYLAGFLFSIPVALTSYINSSLLEQFINPLFVSAIYIISSLLTIFGLFKMPKILTRHGNKFTIILFSFISALSFVLMALGGKSYIVVSMFVVNFIANNFIFASLDIFLEDLTGKSRVGRLRGLYLTIINSAWVIAQLISGSIIAKSSFSGIYLLSALFTLLVPLVIWLALKNFQDPEYKKVSVWKTVKFFVKNKNISKIYFLNLILNFFFAWMVIYTPIYLHDYIGLPWDKIGIIFTIMLLPFVLLQFSFGKMSDRVGERKLLRFGFLTSAIFTFLIPFITEPKIFLFALVLFMTRVGAATIEVMCDSYFFKVVDEEDVEAISFFRNTRPVSYIIAPLVAIVVLALVPSFKFIFPALSVILLFGFFIAGRIKDVK
ncbi:hypothetical protein A2914_00290 [Candidatus Nomurabacteria bacterium RIFCSPLOWO2_01_FULL_41_21]|uniref:Major facilitator superfamily (MFS) profile domain-containing protein n=2 Tax=Candidatus Nomuraibacteriota TaxID=1752729 RepID=A0A1F6V300_9BACT|nr:MAG: hypothetical protein A2733_02695 [Candidatus Nomurabacteria bacterium RIFCSPHIGHO2_01_FULL_40_20]OGI88793.1 MAG: hypothetical protein A2914_00290 [Candidatus Nomurabacteria bacterium RIFCSPLOWO2_01_FULL_41_21]